MSKQSKPTLASIDPGNGGTKGVRASVNGVPTFDYFPSVRARSMAIELENAGIKQLKYETYDWQGQRYVVGNDVVNVTDRGLERHQGYYRYGNEFHMFLTAVSLARLGVPNGEIILTLFAPPGYYNDARKNIKKAFEGQTLRLASNKGKRQHEWDVVSVNVLPEGVGAVGCVAFDQTGQPVETDLLNGKVGFIDVGSYTVDTLILYNGSLSQENMQRATLDDNGIFAHIIEPILANIHAQGHDFRGVTPDAIDMLLQSKKPRILEYGGYEIDLTDDIDAAYSRYANWISNNVIDTELGGFSSFARAFLVGGGDKGIQPALVKIHGHYDPDKPRTEQKGKIVKATKNTTFFGIFPAYWNAVGGLRMTLNHLQNA